MQEFLFVLIPRLLIDPSSDLYIEDISLATVYYFFVKSEHFVIENVRNLMKNRPNSTIYYIIMTSRNS